jgi:arylsulfatase
MGAGALAGRLGTSSASAKQQATPAANPEATPGAGGQPNILVIMGDDIGYWNISAYSLGMMGYRTPNIDRIAREGMLFTDAYGEQSCTAGRAAFITGQSPFRTGLLKIGMPGEKSGLNAGDATIAELLKPLGYATGQFGKNHLGDRNEYLPTVHGFDEFFGNLYHLNAEQEPENPDYPTDPAFAEEYGPRDVLHCWATDVDDPTEDPRWGRVGKQRIEDDGPLDTKRMETVDEEFLDAAFTFIDKAHEADQPFFVWYNPTRMHIFTHLKPESVGVTGFGVEADGMVEHDGQVGQLLQKLDDLGIAENTIVVYLTDNGAQVFSWPDGSTAPFRSEKNSNWEGGYRIPMMVRWPGQIPANSISNDIFSVQDWLPTLLDAAGDPDVTEKLLTGYTVGDKTFKNHIDGFNQIGLLTNGEPTQHGIFYYFTDRGDLAGVRYDRWKVVLMQQNSIGLDVWSDPLADLRMPRIIDLRTDPFERAPEVSGNYDTWMIQHAFVGYPVRDYVAAFQSTFIDYPPRQAQAKIQQIQQLIEMLADPTG